MCPWSWYMATTASYWPARSLTNTVSPGTGPDHVEPVGDGTARSWAR